MSPVPDGDDLRRIQQALLDGFSYADLEQLARLHLDVELEELVPRNANLTVAAYHTVRHFAAQAGGLARLLRAMATERPMHTDIQALVAEFTAVEFAVLPLPPPAADNASPPVQIGNVHTQEFVGRDKIVHGDNIVVNVTGSDLSNSPINIQRGPGPNNSLGTQQPALVGDDPTIEWTRMEGRIRRMFRQLVDLEDRLALSRDEAEKQALAQEIDLRTGALRQLVSDYRLMIRGLNWSTPTDVAEATRTLGIE